MLMRTILAFTILALTASTVRADLELELHTKQIAKDSERVTRIDPEPPAEQTLHVTLGTTWFRLDDGSEADIFDFERRRIHRVDASNHLLGDESLYAVLAGREAELSNRGSMDKALQVFKDSGRTSLRVAEHGLSMRTDAKEPSGIQSSIADGEKRYSWNELELLAWSTELLPAKPAERDQFVQLIRYGFGGHPEILADLGCLDGIPKWLRISDPLTEEATRIEVTVGESTSNSPCPPVPSETAEVDEDPVIAGAIAAVKASTSDSREALVASILAAASAAEVADRPLEAMLGYLELSVIDGQLPPEFLERKDVISANEDVQALVTALGAAEKKDAKAAIKTLTRLQGIAPGKAHVLSIYKANMAQLLGKSEDAVADFRAALGKNPFLTGVWKDLGDIHFQDFDTLLAWRYYEVARSIVPEHPQLAAIGLLEARLAETYPDYF
jgi:tetratricopeptide (TPR) repeat protein